MPSWAGRGDEVIYGQPESGAETGLSTATSVGSSGRVLAQNIRSGKLRTLFTVQAPLSRVEIGPRGRVVFDALAQRNNLREISLAPGPGAVDRWLTHGNSIDRQPYYSPDGESVIFSSSRSGDVDLWEVSTKANSLSRLTDHPAADWDPYVTHDGKTLVWSSNRSGPFEIWMANRDGTTARQVSHDGYDAENPVMTPDGWALYASSHPEHPGLWKVRADGTQPTVLVSGTVAWPDVSPAGEFVLYHALSVQQSRSRIAVVRVADGSPVNFEAEGTRARFSGDGRSIIYLQIGGKEIASQPFPSEPGTLPRVVFRAPAETFVETFQVSPDGKRLVVSYPELMRGVMMADGIDVSAPVWSN